MLAGGIVVAQYAASALHEYVCASYLQNLRNTESTLLTWKFYGMSEPTKNICQMTQVSFVASKSPHGPTPTKFSNQSCLRDLPKLWLKLGWWYFRHWQKYYRLELLPSWYSWTYRTMSWMMKLCKSLYVIPVLSFSHLQKPAMQCWILQGIRQIVCLLPNIVSLFSCISLHLNIGSGPLSLQRAGIWDMLKSLLITLGTILVVICNRSKGDTLCVCHSDFLSAALDISDWFPSVATGP